jgi:pyrroloquinoline quinone biosynthesis protein D
VTPTDATVALAPDWRPRLREGARLHHDRLSGRTVLLFPEGVLLLNRTAAAVLALCDGRLTVREMVAALEALFEAPRDDLAADVADCLLRLCERQFLRLSSAEAP